jgi:hypothetical protein
MAIQSGQNIGILQLGLLSVNYFKAEQIGSKSIVPLNMLRRNLQFVISSLAGEDLFIIYSY